MIVSVLGSLRANLAAFTLANVLAEVKRRMDKGISLFAERWQKDQRRPTRSDAQYQLERLERNCRSSEDAVGRDLIATSYSTASHCRTAQITVVQFTSAQCHSRHLPSACSPLRPTNILPLQWTGTHGRRTKKRPFPRGGFSSGIDPLLSAKLSLLDDGSPHLIFPPKIFQNVPSF